MRLKKLLCIICSCALAIACMETGAGAFGEAGAEEAPSQMTVARASGKFSMEIPAHTLYTAKSGFPLEVGEAVAIKATYSPFSASVDFGLISPDGVFYSLNTTTGSIDKTIKVSQRGTYTLAVRNNSPDAISVSGYVQY